MAVGKEDTTTGAILGGTSTSGEGVTYITRDTVIMVIDTTPVIIRTMATDHIIRRIDTEEAAPSSA